MEIIKFKISEKSLNEMKLDPFSAGDAYVTYLFNSGVSKHWLPDISIFQTN